MQLESEKNLLEIELGENLRRRREELRGKIESYGTAGPQSTQDEDVEARKAELKQLTTQISDLAAKLEGSCSWLCSVRSSR